MATIFVSYAHEDAALIEELRKHLAPLGSVWWDGEIEPGAQWNAEIERQLDEADLVLLGISADFLDSKFIRDHELPRALRRPGLVVPIILRECLWEKEGFAHLQVLSILERDHDVAFKEIAVAIGRLLEVVRAAVHNVPFRRNPNFTGRDALLETIRKERRPVALNGLGGVGKTQTAVEYAYRYADDFDLIWWIASEEPTTRASMYASLAARLGLPSPDQTTAINAVRSELERRERWLLIFDNVEEPRDLDPYLPPRGKGKVLITSRAQAWGRVARAITVHPLQREKSIDLLFSRTKQSDRESADALADDLGDLPLALDQAAGYMEKTAISVRDYLDLFRTRRDELWKDEEPPTDYPATVATTWSLAIEQLSPPAVALMNMAAVLAPEPIPRTLIEACARQCEEGTPGRELADPLVRNRAVAALLDQSLITADETTVLMHRLVQLITRGRMGGEEEGRWRAIVLNALTEVFPFDADYPANRTACALLMPHGLAATGDPRLPADLRGYLLNQLALYAQTLVGDLRLAARLLDQAIALPNSNIEPFALSIRRNRAEIAYALNDFETAKQLLQEAVTIAEATSLPELALSLMRYAVVLHSLDEPEAAQAAVDRAFALPISAENESYVANLQRGLAIHLWKQGKASEALEIAQRVIDMLEKTSDLAGLAILVRAEAAGMAGDAGDLATARSLIVGAIEAAKKTVSERHFQFGQLLYVLATVEFKSGNVEAAVSAYERAYEIFASSFGPDNDWTRSTARALSSLRP